ncbi:MAG: sigma-70 family RNA polymerase sigma factor [Caldilineaceae bacterium]|nr:sigma-70 family RNA polymerase sigma factor [Caldilineaceae bacterium]
MKNGDEQSVQSLWETIYRWAEDSAHHRSLGLDVAHDAAIQAFRRIMKSGLNNYRLQSESQVGGSFRNYCRLIVLNEVKRVGDRLRRRPQLADADLADWAEKGGKHFATDGLAMDGLLQAGIIALQHCIGQLQEREQIVIQLQYWDEYAPQMIADGLKTTRNNVNQLSYRARAKLKDCLGEAGYQSIADVM